MAQLNFGTNSNLPFPQPGISEINFNTNNNSNLYSTNNNPNLYNTNTFGLNNLFATNVGMNTGVSALQQSDPLNFVHEPSQAKKEEVDPFAAL